jgi:phosphoribosylamine--glycine ligase
VVLAAQGYPQSPRVGDRLEGLDRVTDDVHPDCKIFHAGTSEKDGAVVTSGGRVLCVTALGDSVRQAQKVVYGAIADVRFEGMQYRRDIGHQAVAARPTAGAPPVR